MAAPLKVISLVVLGLLLIAAAASSAAGAGSRVFGGAPLQSGAVAAGPLAVSARVHIGNSLLAGAGDETLGLVGFWVPGQPPRVGLAVRWVRETGSWFPTWTLELSSAVGLLPAAGGGSAAMQKIELADASPKPDHDYAVALSYDPASGDVSVDVRDLTQESRIFAASLRVGSFGRPLQPAAGWLQAPPTTAPAATETAPAAGAQKALTPIDFAVAHAYRRQGLPLPMARAFTYAVGASSSAGFVPDQTRFLVGRPISVRLRWPAERVPGEVRVKLVQGQHLTTLARAEWSANPHAYPLPQIGVEAGTYTLAVEYVDGAYTYEIGRRTVDVVRNTVTAGIEAFGRSAAGLAGSVSLTPTQAGLEGTLRISAQFVPAGADMEAKPLGTQQVAIDSEQALVTAPFAFTLPPQAGEVALTASFAGPGGVGATANAHVTVPAAPPLSVVVTGSPMTAKLGQPALLPPGSAYPLLKVSAAVAGQLSGTIRRSSGEAFAEPQPVGHLPGRTIAAGETVQVQPDGAPPGPGWYRIELQLQSADGPPVYDSLYFTVRPQEPPAAGASRIVYPGRDGKLVYVSDVLGNRVPDFSNAGYGGGGVALPDVPVKVTVQPGAGDDTARIQAAIDQVSGLPLDADGFRGAVLLGRGTFEVGGQLHIRADGVVLRGQGQGEDGTVLEATSTEQRPLIVVDGGSRTLSANPGVAITDMVVPVGARSFHVASTAGMTVGDTIVVRRHGDRAWIHAIGMDRITPRPDDPSSTKQWSPFDLDFDRVITAIHGNVITVDAPIVGAIEARWGGGTVFTYTDQRTRHVGVENLRAVGGYDRRVTCQRGGTSYSCDEKHADWLVSFKNVENGWARNLTTLYFQGVAALQRGSKWVTVQDSTSLEPVSIITGGRRYTFYDVGSLNLFQRDRADGARHAFVLSSHVTGPNVYLYCSATNNYATSEPHHRWSVGGLFDNVTAPIAIQDRQWYGSGHGWAGANYVAWNTEGTLVAQEPPTAQNWAIGHAGPKQAGAFAPRPDGFWESLGTHVTPASLYLQQLTDRLGPQAVANIGYAAGGK